MSGLLRPQPANEVRGLKNSRHTRALPNTTKSPCQAENTCAIMESMRTTAVGWAEPLRSPSSGGLLKGGLSSCRLVERLVVSGSSRAKPMEARPGVTHSSRSLLTSSFQLLTSRSPRRPQLKTFEIGLISFENGLIWNEKALKWFVFSSLPRGVVSTSHTPRETKTNQPRFSGAP